MMTEDEILDEKKLAALAKNVREAAGKTKADTARELRVSRPAIAQAENEPDKSFFKLRKRMIEAYSNYEVEGPIYRLKRKR